MARPASGHGRSAEPTSKTSGSAGEATAAIQCPGDAAGTDEAVHEATAHRFERRFPWSKGECVFPSDYGDPSGGRRDGMVVGT